MKGKRGCMGFLTSAQTSWGSCSFPSSGGPPAPSPSCTLGSVSWALRRSVYVRPSFAARNHGWRPMGSSECRYMLAAGRILTPRRSHLAGSPSRVCCGTSRRCRGLADYVGDTSQLSRLPCTHRAPGSMNLQVGSRPKCHCGSALRCHRPCLGGLRW